MKTGIRVLGIDDAAFEFDDDDTFLTGVVYRGTEFIEDIVSAPVTVDGEDATSRVIELFNQCNNPLQVKAIILDGISFGGFNIVDLEKVVEETGKPVVAVTSNRPRKKDFQDTMERTGNFDEKFEDFDDAREVELKEGKVYLQFSGTSFEDSAEIIRKSTIHGLTPEPIRVAHMIGRVFD